MYLHKVVSLWFVLIVLLYGIKFKIHTLKYITFLSIIYVDLLLLVLTYKIMYNVPHVILPAY